MVWVSERKFSRLIDCSFSFLDCSAPDDKKDTPLKGQEYKFIEDFGEQLVGKHQTVVVIYDLETDRR